MRNEAICKPVRLLSSVGAGLAALDDFGTVIFQTRATARVAPTTLIVASVPAARRIGACEPTPEKFSKIGNEAIFIHTPTTPCQSTAYDLSYPKLFIPIFTGVNYGNESYILR